MKTASIFRTGLTALCAFLASWLLLLDLRAAGGTPEKNEAPPEIDPYTQEDPDLMQAAGYVRFAPFPITDSHTTKDVNKLFGGHWMLWVETAHFKIGSTLEKIPIPRNKPDAAKRLQEETNALHDKLPRVKRKPSELDEWLTLHLFAQRAESLYQEFSERFGVKEDTFPKPGDEKAIAATGLGPYLGCKGKFILVLFEEEGDEQRYLARFAPDYNQSVCRYQFMHPECMMMAASRSYCEKAWGDPEMALHCFVVANLVRNLVDGYRWYKYNLPLWWTEGVSHWFMRRVDDMFYSPTLAPGQECDYRRDPDWEAKVLARVKRSLFKPARELITYSDAQQMDFYDHLMSWSRVDFLFSLGPEKAGRFLWLMNELPFSADRKYQVLLDCQQKALKEAFGLDPDSLDAQWSEWVLKNYGKSSARN